MASRRTEPRAPVGESPNLSYTTNVLTRPASGSPAKVFFTVQSD
jgi:hypothetical protein